MIWLSDFLYWFRASAFVVPPPGLAILAVAGVVIALRRPRLGLYLIAVSLVGLYLLGMPIFSRFLMQRLEAAADNSQNNLRPAAIIILGGDADRIAGRPGNAIPGSLSLQRLAGAAALAHDTHLPVLITGGSVGRGQQPVAELMARTFEDGFVYPVTWRELRSRNTCENARFSASILRQAGIPSAWVVTHAWHMRRALLSFAQAGYPVRAAPLPSNLAGIQGVGDFLPSIAAWTRSYYALHEWVGLIAYRFGVCAATPEAQAENRAG